MNKFFAAICLFVLVAQTPLYGGRKQIFPAALIRANRSLAQDAQASDAPSPEEAIGPLALAPAPQSGLVHLLRAALSCSRSDDDDESWDEVEAEVIRSPQVEIVDPMTGNPRDVNLLDLPEDCRGVIIEFLFDNFADVAKFAFTHPVLAQSVKNYFFRTSNSEIAIMLSEKSLNDVFSAYAPFVEGEVAGHMAIRRNLSVKMLMSAKNYLEGLCTYIFFENNEDNRRVWSQAANTIFDRFASLINEKIKYNLRFEFFKGETISANAIDLEGLGMLVTHLKNAIAAAKKRDCSERCDRCCDCFLPCLWTCFNFVPCWLFCCPCALGYCIELVSNYHHDCGYACCLAGRC